MFGIKIIFCIIMVFDFISTLVDNEKKTVGEIIFCIAKFLLFVLIVANKNFF